MLTKIEIENFNNIYSINIKKMYKNNKNKHVKKENSCIIISQFVNRCDPGDDDGMDCDTD